MNTYYYMTKKRDGQRAERHRRMFAVNMEEAISEFSERIMKYEIAGGNDYQWFEDEESELWQQLKEQGYEWKGRGYYALPDTVTMGREDYYPENARIESYRHDVYSYAIEEAIREEDGTYC